MNFNLTCVAFAMTAALVGGSTSAAAEDAKVFPGSSCHPQSHTGPTRVTSINGIFTNSSTRHVLVNCPVVRDTTTNTDGARMRFIVKKFGRSRVEPVRCTMLSHSQLGTTLAANSASTVVPGVRALDITLNRSGVFGAYSATCSVPPRGMILSYKLSED